MRELVQAGALGRVAVVRRRHCIGVLFMEDFLNGPAHWHVETDKNLGMFMDDAGPSRGLAPLGLRLTRERHRRDRQRRYRCCARR